MKLIAIERATILLCDSHPCTGDCIPPHTDHASYPRPICTLSMLNAEPMLLGTRFITTGEGELSCAHPTQHTHLRPHIRPPNPHARTHARVHTANARPFALPSYAGTFGGNVLSCDLPRCSLLVLGGNSGNIAKHCVPVRPSPSHVHPRGCPAAALNRPFVNSCAHAGLLYPVPPSPR